MRLNKFYISVTSDISPLDACMLPAFLPAQEELPVIRPSEVCKNLLNISPFKAIGPDEVPNRIWKKFAPELATPVTDIFNASFSSGSFPTLWKDSYISPIAKVTPVTGDGDLRPIALTPCVSKVQEDFAVRWLIDDVKHEIDPQQFGCLKGTSTTYCLLDILENWLSALDQPGRYLRVCFLDFSRSLIRWICSFLSGRRQAVKLEGF